MIPDPNIGFWIAWTSCCHFSKTAEALHVLTVNCHFLLPINYQLIIQLSIIQLSIIS